MNIGSYKNLYTALNMQLAYEWELASAHGMLWKQKNGMNPVGRGINDEQGQEWHPRI